RAYIRPDVIYAMGSLAAADQGLAAEIMPRLIKALYDEDPVIRRGAVDGLARIAGNFPEAVCDAIPALASRLHDEAGRPFSREPLIRDAAASLLRRLGTPEALDALAKAGLS